MKKVIVLFVCVVFISCTPTHKLQKEKGYEHYNENTQWKN